MDHIEQRIVDESLTYAQYLDLVKRDLEEGQATGGQTSESYLNFSRMNLRRMLRLNKTQKLRAQSMKAFREIDKPLTFLTLTEGWCGDAAQIIPVIEQMAAYSDQIKTRYILRDKYPLVMDAFMTGESRAIPIIIILDGKTNAVLGHWGPRPLILQNRILAAKKKMAQIDDAETRQAYYMEALADGQRWYNKDKGERIQEEFLEVMVTSLSMSNYR